MLNQRYDYIAIVIVIVIAIHNYLHCCNHLSYVMYSLCMCCSPSISLILSSLLLSPLYSFSPPPTHLPVDLPGDVLIFLTGQEECLAAVKLLDEEGARLARSAGYGLKMLPLPLYAGGGRDREGRRWVGREP